MKNSLVKGLLLAFAFGISTLHAEPLELVTRPYEPIKVPTRGFLYGAKRDLSNKGTLFLVGLPAQVKMATEYYAYIGQGPTEVGLPPEDGADRPEATPFFQKGWRAMLAINRLNLNRNLLSADPEKLIKPQGNPINQTVYLTFTPASSDKSRFAHSIEFFKIPGEKYTGQGLYVVVDKERGNEVMAFPVNNGTEVLRLVEIIHANRREADTLQSAAQVYQQRFPH